MPGLTVQIDAAKCNRSLVDSRPARRKQKVDPALKLWRWMINHAVADAKRTYAGMPTDAAILARWWIEEHKPVQADKDDWERSFECCCGWLSEDPAARRKELLAEIDAALERAWREHLRTALYLRRAAVLTCAGIPVRVAKQYVLPLVSELDFEAVAGIDHPDPPNVTIKLKQLRAA